MRRHFQFLLLGALLLVTACSGSVVTPAPPIATTVPSTETATSIAATATPIPATATRIASQTSTKTPTSTPASTPTATMEPTATVEPTEVILPTATTALSPTPAPTQTPAPATVEPPTATAIPLSPTASNTPLPTIPPTETAIPPTATAEPPTPAPTAPAGFFSLVTRRLLNIDENGGCIGNHNAFVKVIDAFGNPITGVTVYQRYEGGEVVLQTGYKPEFAGGVVFDLYGGYTVGIRADADGSSAVAPEAFVTSHYPSNPELISAGYCADEEDCNAKAAQAPPQLCYGHYSYEVLYQRGY